MAQDVPVSSWAPNEVKPIVPARAYSLPIKIAASNANILAGTAMALVTGSTSNTYLPYVSGGTGGSANAECILRYTCSTDASGNITMGAQTGGGEYGQTEPGNTVSAWFGGVFQVADLVTTGTNALDATGVGLMGGKFQQNKKYLSF